MYERKSFFLFLLFVQRGSFPSVHSLFPSYFSSISHTRTSYSPMVLSPIALSSVLYPVQPAMPLDGGGVLLVLVPVGSRAERTTRASTCLRRRWVCCCSWRRNQSKSDGVAVPEASERRGHSPSARSRSMKCIPLSRRSPEGRPVARDDSQQPLPPLLPPLLSPSAAAAAAASEDVPAVAEAGKHRPLSAQLQ